MINVSRASEINEGFEAVWRADFGRAMALLHNADAPGSATMRSRMYLRLGLANRVIAEFELSTKRKLHPRERAELAVIASSAYRNAGDPARAKELWEYSEACAREFRDPLFELVRLTVQTVREFSDGELDRSRKTAEGGLVLANRLRDREAQFPYLYEGNHLRARILEVLSMHAALKGDHQERERLLIDAVLTSGIVRCRDLYTEVNALASLASVLMAYPSSRARELVFARAKTIAWTEHLDHKRTNIKRGLRCSKDLFGYSEEVDHFAGRGYSTLALRLCDTVDRLLYSNWANRSAFDSELAFAIELAERVNWKETIEEEFIALGLLAPIVASRSADLASQILAAYREKAKTICGIYLFAWDGRGTAIESFAEASIAKARGERALALEKYAYAYAFWKKSEMRAHAAFAGLERYTLSREIGDLEAAAEFLRSHPNPAFARRLGRAFERTPDAAPGDFIYLAQGGGA